MKQIDIENKNFPQIEYGSCSNIGNMQEQSWEEWSKDHFECEYCEECGGDWYDHEPRGMFGNYFALCKIALNPFHKVRQNEKEAKKIYKEFEKFKGFQCKKCFEFSSDNFIEMKDHLEEHKENKKGRKKRKRYWMLESQKNYNINQKN